MQQFVQRVVYGLLYVLLVFGSIQFDYSFAALVAVLGVILIYEYTIITKIKFYAPLLYFVFALLILVFLYYLRDSSASPILLLVVSSAAILSQLFLLLKFFQGKDFTHPNTQGFFYIGHGLLSLLCLAVIQGIFDADLLLYFFIVIWLCDSGAYAVGNLIRGKKLMPSVSPNKTISGFAGGVILAGIFGWIASSYLPVFNSFQSIIFSTLIAVIAAVGDLIESKYKRSSGVKDSGKILPGHGGVYDRLDGVIFAAPWAVIIFKIVKDVS